MTGFQEGALVVALVSPAVVMLAIGRHPAGSRSRWPLLRWAQVAVVAPGAAWLALVVTGARGRVGGFYVTPLVAAAGCGTALLTVAVLEGMSRRRSMSVACGALAAVGVGLTAGGDGAQAVAVVGGLALAAVLTVEGPPGTPRSNRVIPALLAAGGVAACGVGFAAVHARSGRWSLPTTAPLSVGAIMAFLACAALLAAYGTLRLTARRSGTEPARRSGTEPGAVLLAGGLAVGLSAAPLRAGGTELGAAVVILATAAVVAAGVRRGALSLALLALAAAAGPAALAPGSRLLAAAAVIAVAVDVPWAWLAAVPGAVSLVTGVVDDGGGLAFAAAVGVAAVAVLLAHGAVEEGRRERAVALGALPAVLAGAWLVIAPGTWTWTGASLAAYDQGMARAVAAALVVVVARVLAGERRTRPAKGSARSPGSRPSRPGRHGGSPAQLVTSGRSASTPRPRRATRFQRARPFGRVPSRPPTGAGRQRRRRSRPPEA